MHERSGFAILFSPCESRGDAERPLTTSKRGKRRVTTRIVRLSETSKFQHERYVLRGMRLADQSAGRVFCIHVFMLGFGRPPIRTRVKEARPLYLSLETTKMVIKMRMTMIALVALALVFQVSAENDFGQTTKTKSIRLISTAKEGGSSWKYMESPKRTTNWAGLTFSDKAWKTGKSGFGNSNKRGDTKTSWSGGRKDLYLRKEFKLDYKIKDVVKATLNFAIDDSFEVWLNGKPLYNVAHNGSYEYDSVDVTETFKRFFRETGRDNVIAVKAHDVGGACFVDLGLAVEISLQKSENIAKQSGESESPFRMGVPVGTVCKFALGSDVEIEFVYCPAGEFTMGYKNMPQVARYRTIRITHPFWMSKTPITDRQLDALNAPPPQRSPDGYGRMDTAQIPVFVAPAALGKKFRGRLPRDYVFRLPTEAEFEYVLKAEAKEGDPRLEWSFVDRECSLQHPWGVKGLWLNKMCLFDRYSPGGQDVVRRVARNVTWTDLLKINYDNQPQEDPLGWSEDVDWGMLRWKKLGSGQGKTYGSSFFLVVAPDPALLNKFIWK